jgi:F-type H+-transporting ATPase subunit delta
MEGSEMPARSGSARRYANALFSIARDHGTLDAWADELTRLGAVVQHPQVRRALLTPTVSIAQKNAVIHAVAGTPSKEIGALVTMLLERKRIELLPGVADAFAQELRKYRGIELAEVTSAVELTAEERSLVAQRLADQLGKTVELTTRVDPAIMGGVVVRVGDQLYDASVRARLQALRERLVSVR